MNNLDFKVFALGELNTNCYVVYDKKIRNAFIVDAPFPFKPVIEFTQKQKLNVLFVVLTHGHFDHIGGLNEIDMPFYVHKKDVPLLENDDLNGSCFFNSSIKVIRPAKYFLEEAKPVAFGSLNLEVIHTPGHTPGSVCLMLDKWLFSGDTIFFNSIGRTDIPLGSQEAIMKSIKTKILTLKDDLIIYPGHGPSTSVEREVKTNPFLNV